MPPCLTVNVTNIGAEGTPMNHRQQRGMTALGMIILVAFVGLFVFAALRLIPIYLEHMKIQSVLDGVEKEFNGDNPSRQAIEQYIGKRFDVESVRIIDVKDVDIKRDADSYVVGVTYENKAPFIANVSFAVDFDKKVVIRR